MKVDEAMLLPTLHKELATEAFANAHHFPQVGGDLSEEDIPSSHWLLSQLYLYFEDKLEVHCRHRRYGTLLFHRSCDLIQALSTALGIQTASMCTISNDRNDSNQCPSAFSRGLVFDIASCNLHFC